jgi:transposase
VVEVEMEQLTLSADEGYSKSSGQTGKQREDETRGLKGLPRLVTVNRRQVQLRPCDLEGLLASDHRARLVWEVVERLDLSGFYAQISARGSEPGRPAIDPKILVTLWLYATSDGVGQARELGRLGELHDAYRWSCGGVRVNHHTLSDFRVAHEGALDELFTQVLGVLLHQGAVQLKRVAHDGMRVRASAGKSSFRRRASLERCLEQAREHVGDVKQAAATSAEGGDRRRPQAAARAARERAARVQRALDELQPVEAAKAATKDKKRAREARASTTDAEARLMRMSDGGFRPAYNVQFATDTGSGVIVGVGVNRGNDAGQLEPMLADIDRRTGHHPEDYLVDGGFVKVESVEHAAAQGVAVYAPVPTPKKASDPYAPRRGDSPAVRAWRARMGTEEAKSIYKERAASAELTNADLRQWRGLDKLVVRGLRKVQCVALWAALTHNLLRWLALAAAAA